MNDKSGNKGNKGERTKKLNIIRNEMDGFDTKPLGYRQ